MTTSFRIPNRRRLIHVTFTQRQAELVIAALAMYETELDDREDLASIRVLNNATDAINYGRRAVTPRREDDER